MSWQVSIDEAKALLQLIADRLQIERALVALDIEATGPYPERDRIVEFALLKVLPGGEVREYQTLVNPEELIPAEATAVHGITDAMVAEAPTFRDLGPRIAAGLQGCDLLAYNPRRFDRRILAAELARLGLPDPLEGAHVLDPFVIFQRAEPRDLAAAVRRYVDPSAAFEGHRAMDDVTATIRVFAEQLTKVEGLPQTLREIHDHCLHKDPSFVDEQGKIVWRGDEAVISFGKNAGRSLEELAEQDFRFLEWMLRSDFPSDTKAIVLHALQGEFPTKPAAPPAPSPDLSLESEVA